MAKDNSLEKIALNLKKITGKIRGEAILNKLAYIQEKKGESGVAAVEKKLKYLGYTLNLQEISSLSWYSDAYSILILLIVRDLFGWDDRKIYNMGQNAPRISFIVKLLMKYFISIKKTFKSAPDSWRKHHSEGSIENVACQERKKIITFKLKNYRTHPIMCVYLKGYFSAYAGIVLKNKAINIKETKCMFKGDPYHEFKITW